MNNGEHQRKQDLVDSLLRSLYETDSDQTQSLVSDGMKRLEEDSPLTLIKSVDEQKWNYSRYFPRFLGIAVVAAAVLLIAIAVPMFDSSRTAMAAIKQSLDQAFEDVGRHYRATVTYRFSTDETQTRQANIFVKGGDQFAIQSLNTSETSVWLGSNQKSSWVIPPVGPVMEGNRKSLTNWLGQQDQTSTPYLRVTTALENMQTRYQLTSLSDDEVAMNGENIRCRRVAGILNENIELSRFENPPDQFDLWVCAETSVAMKIVASWNLAEGQRGKEKATIVLVEERALSDDFFTAEGHGATGRLRINFSTAN